MPRDPQPFPITLDGNLLRCRNEPRIRDLLTVFSKDEITEALAEISEALAGKLDTDQFEAAVRLIGYVQNEDTGLYHKLRCRNNPDGQPELFLSDEATTF